MAGMAKRGKIVAFSLAATGLVVLAAAGMMAWPRLEEEWWFYRLRTGDEDQRQRAAERLGSLGSVRALPELVAAMRRSVAGKREPIAFDIDQTSLPRDCTACYRSICTFGKPALPFLVKALGEEDLDGMSAWCLALAMRQISTEDRQPHAARKTSTRQVTGPFSQ
jgi:hypothetical protein